MTGNRPPDKPSPDVFQRWWTAESCVQDELLAARQDDLLTSVSAARQYFGEGVDVQELLDASRQHRIRTVFREWLYSDHRPSPRSPTLVERLLQEHEGSSGFLLAADRRLLEARRDSSPGLHRITAVEDGRRIEVLDVVTGMKCWTSDHALRCTPRVNQCVPLRLLDLHTCTLAVRAGPVMEYRSWEASLAVLAAQGFDFTAEGTRGCAQLLGRMWARHREVTNLGLSPPFPPAVVDPWFVSTYRVQDTRKLCAILEGRDDVELRAGRGRYALVHAEDDVPLARMAVVPDLDRVDGAFPRIRPGELRVQTSSAERGAIARDQIASLPESRLLFVEELEFSGVAEDPDIPDLPPWTLEAIRARSETDGMQWLDEENVELGGITPRECARNPGRQRLVAALIRSLPRPLPPQHGDIDLPREEMLRSLGLD